MEKLDNLSEVAQLGSVWRWRGPSGLRWVWRNAKKGNRLSCRDQEGRRGSEEAVPGPSVFPSGKELDMTE